MLGAQIACWWSYAGCCARFREGRTTSSASYTLLRRSIWAIWDWVPVVFQGARAVPIIVSVESDFLVLMDNVSHERLGHFGKPKFGRPNGLIAVNFHNDSATELISDQTSIAEPRHTFAACQDFLRRYVPKHAELGVGIPTRRDICIELLPILLTGSRSCRKHGNLPWNACEEASLLDCVLMEPT